ncbi:MAG TPA: hypothetical protein VGF42_07420 [Caulobacteraceae bacterium]|jgi:hypothetical protein
MRILGIAAATALVLSSGVGHAALTGPERATFLAQWSRICAPGLNRDPRFSGVSPRTFASICACAGPRIADQVDFSEMFARTNAASGQRPQLDSAWLQDVGQDAVYYCLNRHGGYMPGVTVTPNK